jgi:hypothetical protein
MPPGSASVLLAVDQGYFLSITDLNFYSAILSEIARVDRLDHYQSCRLGCEV